MTEFRFEDYEMEERAELVEALRDQFEEVTLAYENFLDEVKRYNRLVDQAEKFVEEIAEQAVDSYESRGERFRNSPRGLKITCWIDELREFFRESNKLDFPRIPVSIDPDNECTLADKLEDLSESV